MSSYRYSPQFPTTPELEAVIDEAMASSVPFLNEDEVEWMRNELRAQFMTQPYTAALIAQLGPPPRVEESGLQGPEDAPLSSATARRGAGGGRG